MNSLRKDTSRRERAAALIIVLAFVVLLTGLTVAYLSRATSDRQIAHSSFNQSKADELAASAADLIIGDLRNEMARGSSPTPTPQPTSPIPVPTATPFVFPLTTAAYIVPMRNPTPAPGTTPAIPNLIRRSVRSDEAGGANAMPSPSPGVPSHASAVNSTNDASANGRFVSLPRWNKHYLIPRTAGAAATDTTPISAFNALAPDWVLLTRNGPVAFSSWNSSLADTTVSNTSYCVGRYAFAIYDEGGLLDANVAGYPSNTTAAQYGPKGVSAFADLTVLGMSQSDIDAIVGWRNNLSAGPSGSFPSFTFNASAATAYVSGVLSNTNGFMSVAIPSPTPKNMSNTDQEFTTRQSLLQLVVPNLSANAVNALQYLGTFSREFNAPSWSPTLDASAMGGSAGSTYAYATNANSGTTINPNLLNVTVQSSFTRADGNTANPGEPLIDRRFPLTRISGLGPTGVVTTTNSTIVGGVSSPASATTVQRDFGLVWNNANNWWDYAGPSGSTPLTAIARLDQVAAANREPNFFELLKAVILNGSVGMGSGSANTFVNSEAKYWDTANGSSDFQIIQIGANIISQWNSGNVPIFINFFDTTGKYLAAGVSNLPYLNKLVFLPAWTTIPKKGQTPTQYQFDAWLIPSLWNPHQNAAAWAGNVRIAMTSGKLTATTTSPSVAVSSITASPTPISMVVNASAFATPSAVTTATSVSTGIDNLNQLGYYGFRVTTTPMPSPTATPGSSSTAYPTFQVDSGNVLPTFQMQVDVTGKGTWMAYQTWKGCAQPATPIVCAAPPGGWFDRTGKGSSAAPLQDPEFVTLDPRTLRFGVWGNAANLPGASAADYTTGALTTLDQSVGSPPATGVYEIIPASLTTLRPNGNNFASPTSPNLYLYANNVDATVHYTDLDGVQRQGDVLTPNYTTAMQPTDSADRPVVMSGTYPNPTPSAYANGGFQSVAELGQVFRGQPWKTLSFTNAVTNATANSADAGLLDVFTLHESSMTAGKTSLNTEQPLVLKAILSQATKSLSGTSPINTDPTLSNIITALTNLTTTTPMVNKAELVTRLAANSSVTGLGNKTAREAVMRAFSGVGQTRTWNLLIDLIAQSGRYPSSATSLAGFQVDGEQHYWVHVAIDRFTGQVLDKQIEVVNE